jgi:hypothetical protein
MKKNLILSILVIMISFVVVQAVEAVNVPPLCSFNNIQPGVRLGMKGESVVQLQRFLEGEGVYKHPQGVAYGYFGPATRAGVVRFQEKYGNEVLRPLGLARGTGFVGNGTLAKIKAIACKPVVACTQEAKVCPDGSLVGRQGSNCEFAPCPIVAQPQVEQGSVAPRPVVSVSANPKEIVSDGKFGITNISWTSTNASVCNLEKQALPASGSRYMVVNQTTTYSVSCTGPGGNSSSSVTVPFSLSTQNFGTKPTVTLSVNPTTIVSDGKFGVATLSWTSTNASHCNFEKETLSANGSKTISVGATGSYMISCTGAGGTTSSNSVTVEFSLTQN